ncbi:peptide chain release factor N(5)-glutamine methyltransferase [Peptoniphilus asaccharolyticus]
MEIKRAFELGREYYKESEYADVNREMKMILSGILDIEESYLIIHNDFDISIDDEKKFFEILERRKNGEPLQYILGHQFFYKYDFIVDEHVLIPRYDTEISVEALLKVAKAGDEVLEIGCGTGCVSISLALECPNLNIDCVDISEYALQNTLKNVEKYNCKNINVIKSDLYQNIDKKYDIIYSNPPYIPTEDIKDLQKEVQHEPMLALDGGADGLDIYKRIVKDLDKYLKDKGFLILEIGYDQANDLVKLLKDYNTCVLKDLSGHDRVVIATKGDMDVRKFRSF